MKSAPDSGKSNSKSPFVTSNRKTDWERRPRTGSVGGVREDGVGHEGDSGRAKAK